jgi:hypothetical protein
LSLVRLGALHNRRDDAAKIDVRTTAQQRCGLDRTAAVSVRRKHHDPRTDRRALVRVDHVLVGHKAPPVMAALLTADGEVSIVFEAFADARVRAKNPAFNTNFDRCRLVKGR